MRLQSVRLIYFIVVLLIIVRLGYWQIIKSDDLTARAEGQRLVVKDLAAPRGSVLFNDRSILTSIQPTFLVYAEPKTIDQSFASETGEINTTQRQAIELYKKSFAQEVAAVFWQLDHAKEQVTEKDKQDQLTQLQDKIFKKLSQDLYWVSLGRKVKIDIKKQLSNLNLKGLGFEDSTARFYPEGSASAHLLGFVGLDAYGEDVGYFGLEGYYNGELRGKKGSLTQERDALGVPIVIGKFINQAAKPGKTLVSAIDPTVQHVIEDKLKKGIEKYQAKSGTVIVMDPKTGYILGMASFPSYDPAKSTDYPSEYYKNPATSEVYEPGSTFKVLIMAAGINEKFVQPDTACDICDGPINLGGFTIRTWNNKYRPNLTMTDVMIHSDNTGMVFIARKLGLDRMYSYIQKFGFGQTTNIDLQDEQAPSLRPFKDWREIDLATSSFGQGISVTALQVVRAVGAIANGGKLMEPHMISKIEDGQTTFDIKPKVVFQPVSEEAAKQVTKMMVRAVNEGEAKFYKPKGFNNIAGKTGTAQIPIAGHYDPTKTIASFVGFAPANNPKFVILVKFTEPSTSIFGAETAAPTFFEIANELFTYYSISPKD